MLQLLSHLVTATTVLAVQCIFQTMAAFLVLLVCPLSTDITHQIRLGFCRKSTKAKTKHQKLNFENKHDKNIYFKIATFKFIS